MRTKFGDAIESDIAHPASTGVGKSRTGEVFPAPIRSSHYTPSNQQNRAYLSRFTVILAEAPAPVGSRIPDVLRRSVAHPSPPPARPR